jgi:flagellar motor protein MotB
MTSPRERVKTVKWYFIQEKTKKRRDRRPKRKIKGLVICLLILLLVTIPLLRIHSITSFITKQIIIYQIERRITASVSCDSLQADIFTDRVVIEGVKIISSNQFGEKPFIYIPKIEGYLRYRRFFKKKIIIDDLTYYRPEIFLERNREGEWNVPNKKKYRKKNWLFAQPQAEIKGGKVTLKDGKIAPEPVLTELTDIDLEVSGLSNRVPMGAEYIARGRIVCAGGGIPFRMEGIQDSFRRPLNFSFRSHFKDLVLQSFAPYTRKVTSCRLLRGRMDLETELDCSQNKLDCVHKVVFKDLRLQPILGAEPSLIKVMGMGPATLATVLKDTKGEVRLNIVVQGDIADPDFKIGPALLRAFIKAIQETIIGPFASVAKLVSTEEGAAKIYLVPIEFAKGSANVAKGSLTKLVDLTRFLIKYPVTPFYIEGYVDPLSEKNPEKRSNLGYKRAKKIADHLAKEAKIPEEKLRLSVREEKEKSQVELKFVEE